MCIIEHYGDKRYGEERRRSNKVLTKLALPIRQFTSPIRQLSPQVIQNAISRARKPASGSEIRKRFKQVDFHDPQSVVELASRLTSKRRKEPINVGKHIDDKTYLYSVHFGGNYLPMDFRPDSTRPATALTQFKCSNPSMPKLFFQLGKLRYTSISDSKLPESYQPEKDAAKSTDTCFVVGVDIVDRMAWALWNPDQFDEIDGILPGLHDACTAIPLHQTIDELLANSSTQNLDLDPQNFVTLPQGASITYGGVDEEGWSILRDISPQYKKASNIRTHIKVV